MPTCPSLFTVVRCRFQMAEEYQYGVYKRQDMCMQSHLYFPLLLQMKCPLQYYQNKYKINRYRVSSIQSETEVTTESYSFTLLETQRLGVFCKLYSLYQWLSTGFTSRFEMNSRVKENPFRRIYLV